MPPDEITMHCMVETMGRAGRWADGLRFFATSVERFNSHKGCMQLDLAEPEAAGGWPAAWACLFCAQVMREGVRVARCSGNRPRCRCRLIHPRTARLQL